MESPSVSDLRSPAPEVMSAPRRLSGSRRQLVLMVLATFGASLLITVLLLAAVAARPAVPTAHDAPVHATALARGDYTTRIPVVGHDELARLAGDFNHLAARAP